MWTLWGVALDPLGHFCGKGVKKAFKMDARMETFPMIFLVFVESGSQRLDCACAVGLGFGPLVFTLWASIAVLVFSMFFNMFWGHPGTQKSCKIAGSARVGDRGATPLFDFKNTLLFTCTSCPRWGTSTGSLVGSSLEPAAGFIGYCLCRRPLKKSAGDDFWRPWLTWGAPCKAFVAVGVHLG